MTARYRAITEAAGRVLGRGWVVSVCLACDVTYWAEASHVDGESHGLCGDACTTVFRRGMGLLAKGAGR